MNNNTDLAYLAGLFDGEGCIVIDKWANRLRNGHRYALLLQIKMCDGRLLREIHRKHGGSLSLERRSLKNTNYSDVLAWRLHSRKAMGLLMKLLPYLRLKKIQAQLGIKFQEAMPLHGRGKSPITVEEIELREQCYRTLRELKHSERTYRLI